MSEQKQELAKRYDELTLAEALSDPRTKEQLKNAIPNGITPQMMTRVVLTMVRTTPKLSECSRDSVLSKTPNCSPARSHTNEQPQARSTCPTTARAPPLGWPSSRCGSLAKNA